MRQIPTYKSGTVYAHDSDAPLLRRGLVAAWVWALGITGGIVPDVSLSGRPATSSVALPGYSRAPDGSWATDFTGGGGGNYWLAPNNGFDSTKSFTVLARLKTNQTTPNQNIFAQADGTGVGRSVLALTITTALVSSRLGNADTFAASSTPVGVWVDAAIRYDKATGQCTAWLDGVPGTPSSVTPETTPTGNLIIGQQKGLASNGFHGSMAYMMLYQRALSQAEIWSFHIDPFATWRRATMTDLLPDWGLLLLGPVDGPYYEDAHQVYRPGESCFQGFTPGDQRWQGYTPTDVAMQVRV